LRIIYRVFFGRPLILVPPKVAAKFALKIAIECKYFKSKTVHLLELMNTRKQKINIVDDFGSTSSSTIAR
jgi:hypothetical protein